MKIAFLTTDNREHLKDYSNPIPHFGTAPEALLQGFAMLPDVEVHVVSCVRKQMQSPEKLADNIWYHPVLVPKIGWMTTAYQGCIRAIRKKLKDIQPDIVHGQGTERDCAITAVFSGFPNVLTIHGNMRIIAKLGHAKVGSYAWLNAHLERFTLPLSRGVVCITHYTEDAVRSLAKKTWVLPNAVDSHFFDIKPAPEETPELVVVGVICPRKNQTAFIRALDPIAAERKIKLSFFGMASKTNEYGMEFFQMLEERPWCNWAGMASREELRKRFSKATAVVLPSIEDNCPMVVLEAMAAGIPVIAPNVGGVPDLVTDGVNGILCDPFSEESMRASVLKLLDNPEEAQRMAATAKVQAIEHYHPRVIALGHLDIYREILHAK